MVFSTQLWTLVHFKGLSSCVFVRKCAQATHLSPSLSCDRSWLSSWVSFLDALGYVLPLHEEEDSAPSSSLANFGYSRHSLSRLTNRPGIDVDFFGDILESKNNSGWAAYLTQPVLWKYLMSPRQNWLWNPTGGVRNSKMASFIISQASLHFYI